MGIRDSFKAAVGASSITCIPSDPLGDSRRVVYAYNTLLDSLKNDVSESLKAYANYSLKDKTAHSLKEAANSSTDACWANLDQSIRQYALFNKSCSGSYDSLLKPQLVRLEGKVQEQITHCQAAVSKIEKRDKLYGKMIECKGELEKARTTKKGVEKAEQYFRKAESDFESATTEVEGLINSVVAMHKNFLRDSFETLFEVQKNFHTMAGGEIAKIPSVKH
eukprot:Gregarina_sp_Poly_1__3076@NODE_1866_length_3164_cov_320_885373_g342_i1_p3_GENE_NODE_1866_length_3164_cov_320_885373_g342_i1NODE_1866_length_3164_cov_320_885373_g342_i1_p3_ORF_typecomplete_len221_score43_50BAR/PF03114_18/2_3e11Vps5/PF09325_10/0_00028Phage_HK97_TLTM/PF06120_11/60Phage_HK97_TLTM/PF06120_11/0_11YscOlike/PF16789_5/0_069YscOlike/PF16789_5/49AAA_13/PF13166_6/0_033Bacillus_HBL/PF05791_11/28Bacillus_HBL/PF05791_11/5_4Syntaxin/PF00804_25/0_36_NODE_1866_length_3164_cov_320_885373_g342_i176